MFFYELPGPGFYHIPDGGELRHDLFLRTTCPGGIGEIVVKFLRLGREIRAAFARIVAYRDDEIEMNIAVFVDMIGSLSGNVGSVFFHNGNGAWVDAVRFHARAIDLGFVAREMAQIAFGHLAAATVAGTQDENPFHCAIEMRRSAIN